MRCDPAGFPHFSSLLSLQPHVSRPRIRYLIRPFRVLVLLPSILQSHHQRKSEHISPHASAVICIPPSPANKSLRLDLSYPLRSSSRRTCEDPPQKKQMRIACSPNPFTLLHFLPREPRMPVVVHALTSRNTLQASRSLPHTRILRGVNTTTTLAAAGKCDGLSHHTDITKIAFDDGTSPPQDRPFALAAAGPARWQRQRVEEAPSAEV